MNKISRVVAKRLKAEKYKTLKKVICPVCKGNGYTMDETLTNASMKDCIACNGRGYKIEVVKEDAGYLDGVKIAQVPDKSYQELLEHSKYGLEVMQGIVNSVEKKDWTNTMNGVRDLKRVLLDIYRDVRLDM